MNEIHVATPGCGVELSDVPLVDMESWEPSFIASFTKHLAAIRGPLYSTHRLVAEDQVREQTAPGAGEQVHGSHFLNGVSRLCGTKYAGGLPFGDFKYWGSIPALPRIHPLIWKTGICPVART